MDERLMCGVVWCGCCLGAKGVGGVAVKDGLDLHFGGVDGEGGRVCIGRPTS